MLVELHMKEYEKPHVHTVRKMKHNDNNQIKEHIDIDNGVHLVWVTSSGPGVKSGEAALLNAANGDDVHGIFFVITRINTLNQSGMSLHETFSLYEFSLKWALLQHDKLINSHMTWHTSIPRHNGNQGSQQQKHHLSKNWGIQ